MNPAKAQKLQKKLKPLLFPLSLLYAAAVNLKETLEQKRKKISFDNIKIISIGSIVAGGSGKTPTTIAIAKRLSNFGKVCVITNTYPLKTKKIEIVSIEGTIFKKPPEVPDEAYTISLKVPVTVISSKNRIAAIELAVGIGANFVILDDALHILKIKKDLEICVFDKTNPFGNGLYLPAGTIRNSKSLLKNCNVNICIIKPSATKNLNDHLSCIDAHMEITGILDIKGNKIDHNHKKAFVFCGIANPQSFIKTIESLNIEIVGYKFFEDHHIYTKNEIEDLKKEKIKEKADLLITTLKDYVKINDPDIHYVDVELKIKEMNKIIEEIIK